MLIWRSGKDGRCDYFNDVWLSFTGRTLEQELGEGWVEGVHADDVERVLESYGKSFTQRHPFEMEYRLRRHDGVYRYIFDRGVPFSDAQGEFAGYIGSCVDVDDRRRTDRAKATFLAMLAHELRTPLTAMRAYVGGMRRRMSRGHPVGTEFMDHLVDQVERFATVERELSETARLENGRELAMWREPLDLAPLLQTTVHREAEALARRSSKRGGHRLGLDIGTGVHRVMGDPDRLEQLIDNLLENAVKFSPNGGEVQVRLRRLGSEVVLTVADHGIGIPREEIATLGRRYFRASNAPPENYPGVGLGLALSREIVERHGGRLLIDSELGAGTTVSVFLPAADAVMQEPVLH